MNAHQRRLRRRAVRGQYARLRTAYSAPNVNTSGVSLWEMVGGDTYWDVVLNARHAMDRLSRIANNYTQAELRKREADNASL